MADNFAKAQNVYAYARKAAIGTQEKLDHELPPRPDASLVQALNDIHQDIEPERRRITQLRHNNVEDFSQPHGDEALRLWQLKSIRETYDRLANEAPQLPPHTSPIPELLALRSAGRSATDSRDTIPSSHAELISVRSQLRSEQARLRAYGLLSSALKRRVKRLQALATDRSSKTATDLLEAQIDSQTLQQNLYVDEGDQLLHKLSAFINEHLASMVAAEDLGGPPVGDLIDITDEILGLGFTAKGRPKASKPTGNADELIKTGEELRSAASKELRQLMKRLLRTFDGNPGDYITLGYESAATRFLVQSKIAELDPEDAHRIRLFDFVGDEHF